MAFKEKTSDRRVQRAIVPSVESKWALDFIKSRLRRDIVYSIPVDLWFPHPASADVPPPGLRVRDIVAAMQERVDAVALYVENHVFFMVTCARPERRTKITMSHLEKDRTSMILQRLRADSLGPGRVCLTVDRDPEHIYMHSLCNADSLGRFLEGLH